MKEKTIILLTILVLTAIHSIPLMINQICPGWDCSWYLYTLSAKTDISLFDARLEAEPLLFAMLKPISLLVGEVLAVKIFMAVGFFFFSYGIYMLTRLQKFSILTTLFCLISITFALGISRVWFDTYRNFLLITLLPYFMYYYIDNAKHSTIKATFFMILMALAHRIFIIITVFVVLYALLNKKYFKKSIVITTAMFAFIGLMLCYSSFYVEQAIYHAEIVSYPNIIKTMSLIDTYMFFNIMYIVSIAICMIWLKQNDYNKLFLLLFVSLTVASIFYDDNFGGRVRLFIAIPSVMIIGDFINNAFLESATKNMKLMALFFAISILFYSSGFGFIYLISTRQNTTDREMEILKTYDFKDSYLVTTSRMTWLTQWLSNVRPERYQSIDWYDVWDPAKNSNFKDMLLCTNNYKDEAKTYGKGSDVIIMFNRLDTVINETHLKTAVDCATPIYSDSNMFIGKLKT